MGMDLKFGVDEVTQNRTSRIGVWPKGHIFQSCSENEMKKFQDLFRRRNWKFLFIQNQVDICGIHTWSYTNTGDVDCFILDEVETRVVDKNGENEIFYKVVIPDLSAGLVNIGQGISIHGDHGWIPMKKVSTSRIKNPMVQFNTTEGQFATLTVVVRPSQIINNIYQWCVRAIGAPAYNFIPAQITPPISSEFVA